MDCTLVGCANSLLVIVDGIPSVEGEYTIEVAGDAEASCVFVVDSEGALVPGSPEEDCFFQAFPDDSWSANLPAGSYAVSLSDADGELDSVTLAPGDWSQNFPNGERCGPACDEVTVTLDPGGGIGS